MELKRAKARLGLALFLGIRSGKGRGDPSKRNDDCGRQSNPPRLFFDRWTTPNTNDRSVLRKHRDKASFLQLNSTCATASSSSSSSPSSSFVVIYSLTSGDAFDDADQRACNAITWIASYISPYLGFPLYITALFSTVPYLTVMGLSQSHR